jgi:predicted nucleic acid-binding protein
LALRRRRSDLSPDERILTNALRELIQEGRAQLLGVVRQEILTGIREPAKFSKVRSELHEFEDIALTSEDHENAASMSNRCREAGIAATPADMLICAVTQNRRWQVFSSDRDFIHYARILPIQMMTPHLR